MREYQCCICKDKEVAARESAALDPCALILVSNIDRQRSDQKEQQFFCHFECFRKIVNNDGTMYIMEPDFATIGELDADEESA
jgi:hypothetical protein